MIEHGRFFILHVKLLVGEPLERLRNGRNRELWGWLELWPFGKCLFIRDPEGIPVDIFELTARSLSAEFQLEIPLRQKSGGKD